jgi:SagB-type dehydrogenase family enzyme
MPLGLSSLPLSEREIVFPEIGAMHSASALASGAEARAWRAGAFVPSLPPGGSPIPLQQTAVDAPPTDPIDTVIERRRSNRHYAVDTPISFETLSTMITRSLQGTAMDCLVPGALPLSALYLIVNNVAGLTPGAYAVHPQEQALELLRPGDMRAAAARLACDQDYAADAHVNAYTMTDLAPVLGHFGNRGYRLAQLEASLIGAKLQLAAHALGLGAVGSTVYDDEVTAFFSPHRGRQELHVCRRIRRSTPPIDIGSRRAEHVPAGGGTGKRPGVMAPIRSSEDHPSLVANGRGKLSLALRLAGTIVKHHQDCPEFLATRPLSNQRSSERCQVRSPTVLIF